MDIDFANNLKLERQKKNMTQEDVAKSLGVDEKAVIEWENAQSSPDVETLVKISEIFKVPVEKLIFKTQQKGKGSKAVKLSAKDGVLAVILYIIIDALFPSWGLILLAVLIVICTSVILATIDEKKGGGT